jgi:hypothetical protein
LGIIGLQELSRAPFRTLYKLDLSDVMKSLLQSTFVRCVKTQQYSVINDIINYSRQKLFNVYITDEVMEQLIVKRQFKLSQNLIQRGCSYKTVLIGSSDGQSMSSKTKRKKDKSKNIEKYIKLSDILIYLLCYKEKLLSGAVDPKETLKNEVKILLLNVQLDVDHEDVAKVLIENDLQELLIEMLQQDNYGWGLKGKKNEQLKEIQNQEREKLGNKSFSKSNA